MDRYYIVSFDDATKYIALKSDMVFSVQEGKDAIKENHPNCKKITHIAPSKAKKFLNLFNQ